VLLHPSFNVAQGKRGRAAWGDGVWWLVSRRPSGANHPCGCLSLGSTLGYFRSLPPGGCGCSGRFWRRAHLKEKVRAKWTIAALADELRGAFTRFFNGIDAVIKWVNEGEQWFGLISSS
jgi:hypothetical protein